VVDTLFVIPADERVETDDVNTDGNGLLARETLVGLYREIASSEYRYDPGYRKVTIDAANPCVENLLPDLIRYLDEIQPLVAYVERDRRGTYDGLFESLGYRWKRSYRRMGYRFTPSNLQRLAALRERLDDGSISGVGNCRGSSNESVRASSSRECGCAWCVVSNTGAGICATSSGSSARSNARASSAPAATAHETSMSAEAVV
jgi:hypothetical protein